MRENELLASDPSGLGKDQSAERPVAMVSRADAIDRAKKAAYERSQQREHQPTWGDIYWKWVRRGHDRADAAFRADEWERTRKATP